MPRSFAKPSKVELRNGWLQVDICMRLAFSYYVWQKHFQPADDTTDECKFMRAAALQCSLLNVRSLDEFYRPQFKPDDIRAEHYPNFKNPGRFLSEAEAKQLHQLIPHLTYRPFPEFIRTWKTFHFLRKPFINLKFFFVYIPNVDFPEQTKIGA